MKGSYIKSSTYQFNSNEETLLADAQTHKHTNTQPQSSPRAVATSPSCQARQWKAVGAMPTGKLISVPCTVVRVSLTDTSRKIRGLRRILGVESSPDYFVD